MITGLLHVITGLLHVITGLLHVIRGLLDVGSELLEDGRWPRKAVSGTVEDVSEHVDVVRRNQADVEKTNHATEERAHGLVGWVDVVFPLVEDSRRVRGVSRARSRRGCDV